MASSVRGGYLWMRSRDNIWKKRYVMLWDDMALRFYESAASGKALAKIQIKNISDIRKMDHLQAVMLDYDNPHIFVITSIPLDKIWTFGCDDEFEVEKWMHALQNAFNTTHYPISWSHMAESLAHEMYEGMRVKVRSFVSEVVSSKDELAMYNFGKDAAAEFVDYIQKKKQLRRKEIIFIENAIDRARKYSERTRNESAEVLKVSLNEEDLSQDWPGLTTTLLHDIFNTHRVFKFGALSCTEYGFKEFQNDVKDAEENILKMSIGANGPLSSEINEMHLEDGCTLFPTHLIRDDIFAVFSGIFDVSAGINRLVKCKDNDMKNDIFCCVIPKQVVSLYDHSQQYDYSIKDINNWLNGQQNISMRFSAPFGTSKCVDKYYRMMSSKKGDSRIMVIVFDRRHYNHGATMTVFKCKTMEQIAELTLNNFIGIHFSFQNEDTMNVAKVTRAWLHFGNGQRLRFWPEQLIWFIPRLFVKWDVRGYEFVKRLYADDYKHGFSVNLDDPLFSKYYKMLTSWTHLSVNYRRTKGANAKAQQFGFRDYVEQNMERQHVLKLVAFWSENGYSTDDILDDLSDSVSMEDSNIAEMHVNDRSGWNRLLQVVFQYTRRPESNCTAENVLELWHCHYVVELLENLERFRKEKFQVEAGNILEFDHLAVIRGFDHLIEVHQLFSINNVHRIRKYCSNRVPCNLGADCEAVKHHSSRSRENDGNDRENNEDINKVDSLLMVTRDNLCTAHCYLCHSEKTLYRIRGRDNGTTLNPFTTEVIDQQDDAITAEEDEKVAPEVEGAPLPINLGSHILEWLTFLDRPCFKSFQEEMVRNPASTLSPQMLDAFKMECAAKLDGKTWTEDNFDELLCLKLYSDLTKLQNLFRKAFWKKTPLETKRAFYNWGLMMYKTFLFHAKPIPSVFGDNGAAKLYHGLNKIFKVQDSNPIYQGPFSTTTSYHVANSYANGKGLILMMKGSYEYQMEFIVGINMEPISCFKHEKEMLLYSQTLPIKNTETFGNDGETMVDQLITILVNMMSPIKDKIDFLRGIGVHFISPTWSLIIMEHPRLRETTKCNSLTVAQRLVDELGVKWMALCRDIPFQSMFKMSGSTLVVSEYISPLFDVSEFQKWIYKVSVDGVFIDEEYTFDGDHVGTFNIPVISPVLDLNKSHYTVSLWIKRRRNVRRNTFVALGKFSHERTFARYELQDHDSTANGNTVDLGHLASFDEECSSGKGIELLFQSPLLVDCEGIIHTYSPGHSEWVIGNDSAEIEFIDFGKTIVLSTDGTVVNEADIRWRTKNTIIIQCREFVNTGIIESATDILMISDNDSFDLKEFSSYIEVNRLLFFLQRYPKRITDEAEFYDSIRLKFDSNWLPIIVEHPNLIKRTNYENKNIRHRLGHELEMFPLFVILENIEFRNALCWDGSTVYLSERDHIGDQVKNALSDSVFSISINGKTEGTKYRFGHIKDFLIPTDSSSLSITLWVEAVDGSLKPVAIKTFGPVSCRYNLDRTTPLVIASTVKVVEFNDDDDLKGNGTIGIECNTDIEIAADGGINADGAGLRTEVECIEYSHCVIEMLKRHEISKKLLLTLGGLSVSDSKRFGETAFVPECGGGGIIMLRSSSNIRNHGILSSNGSPPNGKYNGGTICLCADGAIENHGQIDCKPNGRIIVQCREFVNDGMMPSGTELIINEGSEQREIEVISMKSIAIRSLPLSVHRHRGHCRNDDYYHPRNLLDRKGTESRYLGDKPAVGDWIVFKIESKCSFIPKSVMIQNRNGGNGLKSIELSLAAGGDSDEFEPFAVIHNIHRDNEEEQYFNLKDVMVSKARMWSKDHKFLRLRVVNNWGAINNYFYSFALFGVECETNV